MLWAQHHWINSQKRVKEPHKVDSDGHRHSGRPAARSSYISKSKSVAEKTKRSHLFHPRKLSDYLSKTARSGHPKAVSKERQNVHSGTKTKTETWITQKNDSDRRVRQTVGNLLQNQKSATRQEQALQDETIELFCYNYKKRSCLEDQQKR